MNLRIKTSVAAAVLTLGFVAPAFAAPLFPDVPGNHWARDAVATLAAKGIVEGYPDGTFKGDRAATRWEVAMIVARLLAKMEQEHATFATKAELAELQKLVDALRTELDALGVRVTKLEDEVNKLDLRVSELERITFYGSVDARVTAQNFKNSSDGQFSSNIAGIDGINYANEVGTLAGTVYSPLNDGIMPVMDLVRGQGLTSGTGFTMKAVLGLRIRVTDDIDAGAEFAAYTSAGDQAVDALWGVSAPYSCNQFTGDASSQNLSNTPYTRMVLDNFWVLHNPSGTKLTVGAYNNDTMDDILFAGQKNISAFGPEYLDRFGFDLNGSHAIGEAGVLRWEVLGSRIGNGTADAYTTDIVGADLGFEFGGGQVKLNFMRVANEAADGGITNFGTIGLGAAPLNVNYGLANGTTSLQWVNPNGYYAADINAANATVGATNRPIAGWDLVNDGGFGFFGPQRMYGYGASVDYKWDIGESGNEIYAAGEYGHTEYEPNKNSEYSVGGDSFRVEVGTNLLEGDLDLSLAYVSTDPTYDPFVNVNPAIDGFRVANWNMPTMNYYNDMWSLHDTEVYPHNRQGFRFNGQWRFMDRHGLVWAKYQHLEQKETSLYDVRYAAGALGIATPNNAVMGFEPGFMDPVFYGYAHPSIYGGNSANSFNGIDVLDGVDNKGKQDNWGLGVTYKWDNPRLKLDLGYDNNTFKRDCNVAIENGQSQNYVNLKMDNIHAALGWEANDQWTLRAGCDIATVNGHWDPSGLYNTYAMNTGISDFKNLDVQQTVPFIGFDYDLSANTQWNMDFRYYDNVDKADGAMYAGNQVAGNLVNGYSAHPFSWNGWQVTTQFKLKF